MTQSRSSRCAPGTSSPRFVHHPELPVAVADVAPRRPGVADEVAAGVARRRRCRSAGRSAGGGRTAPAIDASRTCSPSPSAVVLRVDDVGRRGEAAWLPSARNATPPVGAANDGHAARSSWSAYAVRSARAGGESALGELAPVLVRRFLATDRAAVDLGDRDGHRSRAGDRTVVDRVDRRHLRRRAAHEHLLGDVQIAAGEIVDSGV